MSIRNPNSGEMQTENTPTSGEKSSSSASASSATLQFSPNNPFLSPKSPDYMNSNSSLSYSSLYQSNSPTNSPSVESWDADLRLHEASYVLEYQQLYNRYTLCLTHLHDSIDEVEALRRENESLRVSNADLTHRVALLFSRDRLLSEFNRLSVAASSSTAPAATRDVPVHVSSGPQPLAEHNRSTDQRVSLPKSISVRSTGYLKTNRPVREPVRRNTVSQPVPQSQKVSIPAAAGAKKENVAALEFDVYNQGMQKTELCNKWQETGACPYNENCQFAHGIKELRPVIRHPRYKTEVCRMVLAGDMCPYGHRCHFRHALTDQERLLATPSSKLPR